MIRIAIVDDQAEMRNKVRHITEYCMEEEGREYRIDVYSSGVKLLEDIKSKDLFYEIYLLDIEMEAMNGLELARNIRQLFYETYIVFVSSYSLYGTKGYEYQISQYVVKNRMDEELPPVLKALGDALANHVPQYYVIENHGTTTRIRYINILYIRRNLRRSDVYTSEGVYQVRRPLKQIMEELNAPEFVFAGSGHIVNLKNVMSLAGSALHMRFGSEVPLSERNMAIMRSAVMDFWTKNEQ